MVHGSTKVYIPAFEKANERRNLIEKTKDLSYLPRAPLSRAINPAPLKKAIVRRSSKPKQIVKSKSEVNLPEQNSIDNASIEG